MPLTHPDLSRRQLGGTVPFAKLPQTVESAANHEPKMMHKAIFDKDVNANSDIWFERLMKLTESSTESGDPFDPDPLPEFP